MKDTLEVPSFEAAGRDCRKMVPEEMLSSTGRKCSGTPGTPPPTPQQPPPVSQEKQFKQFSKKLKGKLAKEFSPATPPSTPHYQSASGLTETHADSDKADFMLKLMRTRVCGFEIPKIHIDLEKKAAFAEEMVSSAIEKAKRELSNTSLNADSGIGHDGASFAESLATEIMTSAMSNICQTINVSPPGRERTYTSESTVSQQLSLSAGEDSLGSWSNLSFEDEHPDESSSFLHLSDSNGNSSSWSSLGLEGEVCEEHLSLSPSNSDGTEEKDTETKEDIDGLLHAEAGLAVINMDLREQALDPQVRTVLQWIAASHSDLPAVQLGQPSEGELQQLPAVLWRVRAREWKVGELFQALLRYCEEAEPEPDGEEPHCKPFFQWLLEHA
ncbi:hypothetical protein MATL_G00150050 [Megalops atlanticus]|uniref:A-kinase anchor protein 11 n=1 Tax=Megalops atlanticus TaxID=7932 RepID=A0A9D3PSJ1_MEGAT|nr:hypothetical protein MATL_G00150050 [Megalops atlanticus]